MADVSVRHAHWEHDRDRLCRIREAVFVVEQKVPRALEWDGLDAQCEHVLAEIDGEAVGTGRLLPDGHIGRIAVLAAWRGRGIGSALLRELTAIAVRRGLERVVLHAQTHARHFYEQHGFRAEGEEFSEAGIPHVRMAKPLR
ncbi:MAG TPA: GNAT family N-acetyltransferase [Burkholderiales bacterium]|nr:GNAT family N-acetyltransferase [Burkholderiales bacterium]